MAVEVGQAYIPVKPDMSGFGKDLERQAGGGGVKGKLGGIGKTLGAAFAGAFAVSAGFNFARGAIDSASDLNETVSKSRTIFGSAAGGIEKWAAGAAKGFGQSKQQALDAAGTFGNLFVQLGIGSDKAADMSTSMVELASDFASFHNADPTQVIEAQTAAFRGEYDALQKFVPTINAAAVEQEALAMTGKSTTKELTLQEKALATQSLMMKGAGDAAGDFARTSDGLANQQRIQSAQWADMTAKIGQGLLPVMTAVTGFIIDHVIPAIGSIASFIQEKVVPAIQLGAEFIAQKWAEIAEFTRAHWDSIQQVIGTVLGVIKGLWDTFGANLLDAVKVVWNFIRTSVENAIKLIQSVIQTVMALIRGDWGKAWDGVKGIVSAVWDQIKNIVSTALKLAREAVQLGMDAVKAVFRAAWDAVKDAASNAVNAVVGFVSAMPGRILGLAGQMLSAGAGLGGKFLEGLKNGLTAAASFAGDVASGIVNVVKDAWNQVAKMINDFVPNEIGWGPFKMNLPDNPIPRFHDGGMFRSASPGGEGFALLRDRELVTTPEDQAAVVARLDRLISRVDRLTDTQVLLARTY